MKVRPRFSCFPRDVTSASFQNLLPELRTHLHQRAAAMNLQQGAPAELRRHGLLMAGQTQGQKAHGASAESHWARSFFPSGDAPVQWRHFAPGLEMGQVGHFGSLGWRRMLMNRTWPASSDSATALAHSHRSQILGGKMSLLVCAISAPSLSTSGLNHRPRLRGRPFQKVTFLTSVVVIFS